jgi:hypothetical protein
MCVLVVCTFDHIDNTGTSNTPSNWKRGDVVWVGEDGQSPGLSIENNAAFRLIHIPGIPASRYHNLTSPETATITNPLAVNQPPVTDAVRKRHFTFDLATAEASAGAITPTQAITITDALGSTLASAKTPIPSANILSTAGLPATDTVVMNTQPATAVV